MQKNQADLQVTGAAAMFGSYGMLAKPIYRAVTVVYDNTPVAEPRYRMRVYFDPNDVVVGASAAHLHTIVKVYTSNYETITQQSTVALVELRKSSGVYQVRAGVRNDAGGLAYSGWYNLVNGPNALELDWQAAAAPGANNGSLALWIGGMLKVTLSNIDNDAVRAESVALGAVEGVDLGAAGSYCFDAFVSRREESIGLESGQPQACGSGMAAPSGDLGLGEETLPSEAILTGTMALAAEASIPADWLPWTGLMELSPTETITVSGFLNTGQWFAGGLPAADAFLLSDGVTVTLLLSETTTLAVVDSGGIISEQPLEVSAFEAPLTQQTSNTVVIAYSYDPLNRLTAVIVPNLVTFSSDRHI